MRAAIERVVAGGWYIQGPEHRGFEDELAIYLGARHAVGVASGTDALVLALAAVGCTAGSEIVTVANAGGYASCAAAQLGATVVYADVDAATMLMTLDTLQADVGDATDAVVVTHLYGNIAETGPIVPICRDRGISLIEDCTQSLGGVLDGRRARTFGDAAAISFYPTKNLGAAGDGGAVISNDDGIADRVRRLRRYGWTERYLVSNGRWPKQPARRSPGGHPAHRPPPAGRPQHPTSRHHRAAAAGSDIRFVTGAGRVTLATPGGGSDGGS